MTKDVDDCVFGWQHEGEKTAVNFPLNVLPENRWSILFEQHSLEGDNQRLGLQLS